MEILDKADNNFKLMLKDMLNINKQTKTRVKDTTRISL